MKLKADFIENPESLENDDLENYLEGMIGYCYGMHDIEPSWKNFANILLAAIVYE